MYEYQIEEYLRALHERGCKQSTIETRHYSLKRVLERMTALGYDMDPRRIDAETIRDLAHDPTIKESTARLYVFILTDFCRQYGNEEPAHVRILWNRTTPTVCWIDTDDLRKLMKGADPPERMALVLGTMAGLRASEIANLTTGALHHDYIEIRGKGHGRGLEAHQPISATIRAELDRYLRWRSKQAPESDRLIIWRGHAHADDNTSNARVVLYRRIKALGDREGIEVSPHALRRLYATTLYNQGVDILTISKLMRHATADTTAHYIRGDRAREYAAIDLLAAAYN